MLEGKLEGEESFRVECNYLAGKGKKVLHNGQKLERLSTHIGRIPLVCSLPEDLDLVNEGAGARRKWMDVVLCQAEPRYLTELSRYERALRGRNALLDAERDGVSPDPEVFRFLTETLIEAGVEIQRLRASFLREFTPDFEVGYRSVAGVGEKCAAEYVPDLSEPDPDLWRREASAKRRAEASLGRTLFGIHRDDWNFFINDKSAKAFGSQGQRKTFVLALKIAQFFFLERRTKRKPVLILDDVFDKFDPVRVGAAARLVADTLRAQAFVTDADPVRARRAFPEACFFSTENGFSRLFV
ncbi:MAG: DNA replication and repair protein RecF, partial [Bacteroidia bacterium]|nr:DNA replication and repair protein RecF [Bacteroidia bacterium]